MSAEKQTENDDGVNTTEEEVIEQIQMVAEDESPPTAEEFSSHPETMSLSRVGLGDYGVFETWNAAVDAAGFEPRDSARPQAYTDEELIEQLQEKGGDSAPTKQEFEEDEDVASPKSIQKRFGSWNDGVKAAGFEPNKTTPSSDDEERVINKIQQLAEDGDPPTAGEFNSHEGPSSSVAYRVFGTWSNAVEAAGFEPNKPGNDPASQEELIEHINRLTVDGDQPSQEEFNEDEEAPSARTVENNFDGGWNVALEQAEQARS